MPELPEPEPEPEQPKADAMQTSMVTDVDGDAGGQKRKLEDEGTGESKRARVDSEAAAQVDSEAAAQEAVDAPQQAGTCLALSDETDVVAAVEDEDMDEDLEAEALALMAEYGLAPMSTEQQEQAPEEVQEELPPPTYTEAIAYKAEQEAASAQQTEEARQEAVRLENERQVGEYHRCVSAHSAVPGIVDREKAVCLWYLGSGETQDTR